MKSDMWPIAIAIVLITIAVIGGLLAAHYMNVEINDCPECPEREDICPNGTISISVTLPKEYDCTINKIGNDHFVLACD